MPLQCGTQWDALSHAFNRNVMWNGYPCTEVSSFGARRGVQRRAPRQPADRARRAARRRSRERPRYAPRTLRDHGARSRRHRRAARRDLEGRPRRHLDRANGPLRRTPQEAAGRVAGGPAPGLSFSTLGWLYRSEIAAVATDTWGVEVKPNEWPGAFQPFHQSRSRTTASTSARCGTWRSSPPMRGGRRLRVPARRPAADSHRLGRLARQPHSDQIVSDSRRPSRAKERALGEVRCSTVAPPQRRNPAGASR